MIRPKLAFLIILSSAAVACDRAPSPAAAEDVAREMRTVEIGVPDMH